jgi:hypothetical protein
MNKYLVYTISDLKENSINCTNLLHESLKLNNNNFDFYVITNNSNYNNISTNHNIIYDNIDSPYIGWLKYTQKLPDGYSNYFYFDSDILCYEKLENLAKKNNISIVKENIFMSHQWFNYPFAKEADKSKFKNINGINAGLYIFENKSFLREVFEKSKSFDISSKNTISQAMFEQSCFNYTVFKLILNNYYDITSFVKLRPQVCQRGNARGLPCGEITAKTIYHFCNWEASMDKKYNKMKIFHKKYIDYIKMKIIDNRDFLLEFLPKNLIVAEIGVFKGEFSKKIYDVLSPKELHLIDIFEGRMCSGDKDGNNIIWINLDTEYEKLKNKLEIFPNIILHKGLSLNILNTFKDDYFDIIYVDADHNYESVKKDLELSFRKIKNGGYLCGHDYGNMFPGVIRAVDEFCIEKKLYIKYLTQDGSPSFCIQISK